ncbi:MAG: hypothetical protein KGI08_02550 [Thaumarchaeota archaeon]|nr:hypothetical protein [Nitrososphaerota archaeon]
MPGQESAEKPFIPTHTQRSSSKDKEEQEKALASRIKELRMSFAVCFSTPDGKKVLGWLLEQSGFLKSQVGGNPAIGMDVETGTLYNCARESLYIEMRRLVPSHILKEVEYQSMEELT